MATQVDFGLEGLFEGAGTLAKDPTISLDANVKKVKKTPLTFEQLKDLLNTGSPIPEGFDIPSNLTKAQMGQLPGGASAFQNIPGYGMMESIKATAGFGTGPGGVDTDPNEEEEKPVSNVLAHKCPDGYMFDSIKQACVPILEEKENDGYDGTQDSYNSFVDMISSDPNFDGTMESFTNVANDSWLGSHWNTFFNDDKMLSDTFNTIIGPDIIYGGGGSTDFEGMPTSFTNQQISDYQTANQQPEPVIIPNELLPDIDPVTYEMEDKDKPDNAGTIIQSGPVYSGQTLTQYQPPQKEETNRPEGKTFDASFNEKVEKDKLSAGFGKGDFGFNEGGFIQQSRPLQLSDVSLEMQEGGEIPVEQPMEGMPVPSGQPAGFIEDPSAAPAPDTPMDAMQGEGQKDDVMGELPEGTFVINAMAVQLAGLDELDKMVEDAYETMVEMLKEKGVDVPLIQQLVDRSRSIGKVDVAVSNGEYIIPPELVPIIGEDKLRKINDRGLRKLEETKKTRQKQQAPAQMDDGGFVIATDPDGKIQTVKEKGEDGREVSRILSRDEADSLGVAKQGKQGTSFIPKPKTSEDQKQPEVKQTEPSDKVTVEKLDLLGPKPNLNISRFYGPELPIDQQLSIPQQSQPFVQQEPTVSSDGLTLDNLTVKQQNSVARNAFNNNDVNTLNILYKDPKVSPVMKERLKEYILNLDLNYGSSTEQLGNPAPESSLDKINNALDKKAEIEFDARKYNSSINKKKHSKNFMNVSLNASSDEEITSSQQTIGERMSAYIKSLLPTIDPEAKQRFREYMTNNVGKSVTTSFGLTTDNKNEMSDSELIQKFSYNNYKNLSEEELKEAQKQLLERFTTNVSLGVRNFKRPTKGDTSWITESLLDAIRQKESSNRHLDVDGTLFKHPNSKALGAYGIKPSTAADPGAKFVELNPNLVPIADLTKELNEDKHREFAKNYLIAITLRFPELSPSDVIRAYNAGPTKVNSVLSGQGTFNQEALDYPNQVMEILQSSSNARTGGFV